MEDYGAELAPRILTTCGHTACQLCLDKMLRPITARGNHKPLSCPTCRRVTKVPRGAACNLPQDWSLLQ